MTKGAGHTVEADHTQKDVGFLRVALALLLSRTSHLESQQSKCIHENLLLILGIMIFLSTGIVFSEIVKRNEESSSRKML